MIDSTHFNAKRQSQSESMTEGFAVVHQGTLPVRKASSTSQRETSTLGNQSD